MTDREDYLHPEAIAFLKAAKDASENQPKLWQVPIANARKNARELAKNWNAGTVSGIKTKDFVIDLPGRSIRMRWYRSELTDARNTVLVYAHGGGWIVGDLDFEDLKLRKLALWSGYDVISVDYRLAPEFPCPAGRDDVVDAVKWLRSSQNRTMIRANRLLIGGASAGANLALSALLLLRDENYSIDGGILFYGVYDLQFQHSSYHAKREGFGLETHAMEYFRKHYAGADPARWRASDCSPGLDDLRGAPPLFVNAVSHDPLFGDSLALQESANQANADLTLRVYDDTIHGFTAMSAIMPHADEAIADAAKWMSDLR